MLCIPQPVTCNLCNDWFHVFIIDVRNVHNLKFFGNFGFPFPLSSARPPVCSQRECPGFEHEIPAAVGQAGGAGGDLQRAVSLVSPALPIPAFCKYFLELQTQSHQKFHFHGDTNGSLLLKEFRGTFLEFQGAGLLLGLLNS